MSFASTSSTSFQNRFTQNIKRSFYSNVHACIHVLRMLLRTILSKHTATFNVHSPMNTNQVSRPNTSVRWSNY